jgi:hypothetical protein
MVDFFVRKNHPKFIFLTYLKRLNYQN